MIARSLLALTLVMSPLALVRGFMTPLAAPRSALRVGSTVRMMAGAADDKPNVRIFIHSDAP